jgi:hypothetical protein
LDISSGDKYGILKIITELIMLCEISVLVIQSFTLFHPYECVFIVMPASILVPTGGAHLNGTLHTAERRVTWLVTRRKEIEGLVH